MFRLHITRRARASAALALLALSACAGTPHPTHNRPDHAATAQTTHNALKSRAGLTLKHTTRADPSHALLEHAASATPSAQPGLEACIAPAQLPQDALYLVSEHHPFALVLGEQAQRLRYDAAKGCFLRERIWYTAPLPGGTPSIHTHINHQPWDNEGNTIQPTTTRTVSGQAAGAPLKLTLRADQAHLTIGDAAAPVVIRPERDDLAKDDCAQARASVYADPSRDRGLLVHVTFSTDNCHGSDTDYTYTEEHVVAWDGALAERFRSIHSARDKWGGMGRSYDEHDARITLDLGEWRLEHTQDASGMDGDTEHASKGALAWSLKRNPGETVSLYARAWDHAETDCTAPLAEPRDPARATLCARFPEAVFMALLPAASVAKDASIDLAWWNANHAGHDGAARKHTHVFKALAPGPYLLVLYRPGMDPDDSDDAVLTHEIQLGAGDGLDVDLADVLSWY